MSKLKLSDKSNDAAHADVITAAKEFYELTKLGKVKRMIIVYEVQDGKVNSHYSAAGIKCISDAFSLLEETKFLLNRARL